MRKFTDPASIHGWSDRQRSTGRTIGLVATMGALHRGHHELVRDAHSRADIVVVSIFVNPLQFDQDADFDSYPRPIEDDIEACRASGVGAVYAPTAAAMYPPGFETNVVTGALAAPMEGARRAGHFDGVATVVTKLLCAVRPDIAIFGEKDYQQLAIVRRLTLDLHLGVEIVGHPTVRESDGLALSSRNVRLTVEQRQAATCIPRALAAAASHATEPTSTLRGVLQAAHLVLGEQAIGDVDYVNIFDSLTLQPLESIRDEHRQPGMVRIATAVQFGDVRLIDNRDLFDA